MAKRQFSSAQLKRLKSIQSKRLAKAEQKLICTDDSLTLGPEQHGLLITHHSVAVVVKRDDGKLFICTLRQNLSPLVTGDNVIWQAIDDHTGVVTALIPRRSVVVRPHSRGEKPIVSNIDLMVIVVALAPLPQVTTIDRYLILANIMKLKALIVVNKCDLISSTKQVEQQTLLDKIPIYEKLGYHVIKVSTKERIGIDKLEHELKDINSILVGQSGVGKSSLLNTLIPDSQAQTSSLSHDDKFGRQTTSASKLYQLPLGGNLIDSPGIHQFNLHHFSQEQILSGFTEFGPFLGACQFRNCTHAHEPKCALRKAVVDKDIAAFRLQNYHTILLDE